jgi:hypothetical protein
MICEEKQLCNVSKKKKQLVDASRDTALCARWRSVAENLFQALGLLCVSDRDWSSSFVWRRSLEEEVKVKISMHPCLCVRAYAFSFW